MVEWTHLRLARETVPMPESIQRGGEMEEVTKPSETEDVTKPKIRLADAIAELRAEISRARRTGEGQEVRFAAKTIELELSMDFGWSAEVSGGVSKWIPLVDL